jgi:hypothetical protein
VAVVVRIIERPAADHLRSVAGLLRHVATDGTVEPQPHLIVAVDDAAVPDVVARYG